MSSSLTDTMLRPLRDLRISVTDRCNFRCRYCMPAEIFGENYEFLPRKDILSFEEIHQLASIFASIGVEKLRLTGGEPLLRRDLDSLINHLSSIHGIKDIAMTTNGSLLTKLSQRIKDAGLNRVTVSLDASDPDIFEKMNGTNLGPQKVLNGIESALNAGLGVKLNTVIKKGMNECQILPITKFAYDLGIPVRFIEYMDTGNVTGWNLDEVVSSENILNTLKPHFSLTPRPAHVLGETSVNHTCASKPGFEVGFISSITKPFCAECNRARLSADGKIFHCLFASDGYSIKDALRSGASEQELRALISQKWSKRDDRYSQIRGDETTQRIKAEMSYLGG